MATAAKKRTAKAVASNGLSPGTKAAAKKAVAAVKGESKKKGRYTLTARLEGEWRWAVVGDAECSPRSMKERAKKVLDRKIREAKEAANEDASKEIDVTLWTQGGITLTNPEGRIIWSRSIQ